MTFAKLDPRSMCAREQGAVQWIGAVSPTREALLSPADISRNWRSVNLMAQITFDRFYAEVLEIDTLLRSLWPRR